MPVRLSALLGGLVLLAVPVSAGAQEAGQPLNDYPTVARADYVIGCMATNGQSREALERCSCSIDVIASLLPYQEYVAAETVMRLRLVGGEKTTLFRTTKPSKDAVAELRRAQVEAEVRCF